MSDATVTGATIPQTIRAGEAAHFGGDIDKLVHPAVARALREKYHAPSFGDGKAGKVKAKTTAKPKSKP